MFSFRIFFLRLLTLSSWGLLNSCGNDPTTGTTVSGQV
jgi:hypothetical protein